MLYDTYSPIYTTMFGKSFINGKWLYGRKLPVHLLMYLFSGSLQMEVEGEPLEASAGDVILIPADTFYLPIDSDNVHYYFFHFHATVPDPNNQITQLYLDTTEAVDRSVYRDLQTNPYIHVARLTHCKENILVQNLFSRLLSLTPWKNNNEKLLVDSLLRELLVSISLEVSAAPPQNKTFNRILQYMAQHYKDDISLNTLAEEFDLSISYITRLFQQELSTSFTQYLTSLRLVTARNMLLNSNDSIGNISENVGFHNQYYFTRLFRKYYHTTPSEYRKKGLTP